MRKLAAQVGSTLLGRVNEVKQEWLGRERGPKQTDPIESSGLDMQASMGRMEVVPGWVASTVARN